MAEGAIKRKRRRHAAAGTRIAVAGASTGAMLGMVAALGLSDRAAARSAQAAASAGSAPATAPAAKAKSTARRAADKATAAAKAEPVPKRTGQAPTARSGSPAEVATKRFDAAGGGPLTVIVRVHRVERSPRAPASGTTQVRPPVTAWTPRTTAPRTAPTRRAIPAPPPRRSDPPPAPVTRTRGSR